MTYTYHPFFAGARTPGQVPRLDREIDKTMEMPPRFTSADAVEAGHPARPILRAANVAADLGLPAHATTSISGLVKTLSGASTHELDFRRGVMEHLIEQRYEPTLRRAILERALSFYRSSRSSASTSTPTLTVRTGSRLPNARSDGAYHMAKPKNDNDKHERDEKDKSDGNDESLERGVARGGRYHRRVPIKMRGKPTKYKYVYDEASYRKIPGAHIDGASAAHEYVTSAVRRVLDKAGDDGCAPEDFRKLVARHGSKHVAAALHGLGARHDNGRIRHGAAKSMTDATPPMSRFGIYRDEGRSESAPGASIEKASPSCAVPCSPHISLHKAAFGVEFAKADAAGLGEARPASSSGGSFGAAGGGMPSSKKLPPGTRRIWHNRVVERGVDDKWHVVGHVAGLEDPGKTPLLNPQEIDPDHLKELIAKIKALLGHEKEKHALLNKPIPAPPAPEPAAAAKPENKTEPEPESKTKTQEAKAKTPAATATAKSTTHAEHVVSAAEAAADGIAKQPRFTLQGKR